MSQAEKYRPHRERLAQHLHALGPQPMFLAMLGMDAGASLDQVLRKARAIEPGVCHAIAAERFPPRPDYAVGYGR